MNRQQRRANNVPNPRYSLTEAQFNHLVQQEVDSRMKDIKQELFNRIIHLTCYCLHEEFEFGKGRLERFMCELAKQMECLNEGRVKVADIKKWLLEKYQLDFSIKYK